jgi:hypothetical protein
MILPQLDLADQQDLEVRLDLEGQEDMEDIYLEDLVDLVVLEGLEDPEDLLIYPSLVAHSLSILGV